MARSQPADRAGQGEQLSLSDAEIWNAEGYEVFAARFAEIYDELVERLAARPGEHWLDVATGSGEVAIRAARAGAAVTGIDFSEGMLARARRKAEGLVVQWDLGDAQALPYADAAFDVVSSNFGVIFPPDADAVAHELGRVCCPGGRLGLTTWRPRPALTAIYARFGREPPPAVFDDWGREEFIEGLLAGDFEVTIEERTWYLEGDSPEEVFELMAASAPATKAYLESIDETTRGQLREALIEYWAAFRENGGVREPRQYLLVLGTRR